MENQTPINNSIQQSENKTSKADFLKKKKLSQHEFFILQIKLWGKFVQTSPLIVCKKPSAEKCDVHDKHGLDVEKSIGYNFATISFVNKKSGNQFLWKNVCPQCLDEAGIKYVYAMKIQQILQNHPKVLNVSWKPYKSVCAYCFQELECIKLSIEVDKLPFEVFVCKKHAESLMSNASEQVILEKELVNARKPEDVPAWMLGLDVYNKAQEIDESTLFAPKKKNNNKKKKNAIPEGDELND